MSTHTIITPTQWTHWSSQSSIEDPAIFKALSDVYTHTTLYERLDHLIALHELCKNNQSGHDYIHALQKQAEKFIEIIGNSSNIEETIRDRKQMRDTWPTFLPHTSLAQNRPFRSQQTRLEKLKQRMQDHVHALERKQLLDVTETDKHLDKLLNVKMLTPLEKEHYRIMPSDGLLWQLKQPDDDDTPLCIQPFDTSELFAHNKKPGFAIFVMNPQGELFAGSSDMDKFHHSSFQAGGFVGYGGTMKVSEGNLQYVDDYSGHYSPKAYQFFTMLKEFLSRGLIHENTIINKKFNEFSGMKIGSDSTILNTRGFLGQAPISVEKEEEPVAIDHYAILQSHLFDHFAEDQDPVWVAFAAVMREYLKNEIEHGHADERIASHYNEIQEFAAQLGLAPDVATSSEAE